MWLHCLQDHHSKPTFHQKPTDEAIVFVSRFFCLLAMGSWPLYTVYWYHHIYYMHHTKLINLKPNQRAYMNEFIAANPGIVDVIREWMFFSIVGVSIVQGFLVKQSFERLMDAITSLEQSLRCRQERHWRTRRQSTESRNNMLLLPSPERT
jgi:hypothetical protein